MPIVYLLTNKVNGKRYVGKTSRPLEVRWQGHLGSARRGDSDMLVCRAVKKHGPDAFERRVLEECADAQLGEREIHWINEHGTHLSQDGYSLTFGGDGGLPGYRFSEESREKMRQKALGRKHSEETKAKMCEAKLGKKQSPEVVEARRQKLIGQKRTEEQYARISESLKGRTFSDETRARISEAAQGRVLSNETKKKLSTQVDLHAFDGTFIRTFDSMTAAATPMGVAKGTISNGVRTRTLVKGYELRRHVDGE